MQILWCKNHTFMHTKSTWWRIWSQKKEKKSLHTFGDFVQLKKEHTDITRAPSTMTELSVPLFSLFHKVCLILDFLWNVWHGFWTNQKVKRVSCNGKYGMHYDDESPLFSMQSATQEREDANVVTRRNWKRERLTVIACMSMGFSRMFSIEMEVLIMCITLMGRSYWNTGVSGSIFWTAEYQNIVFCTVH